MKKYILKIKWLLLGSVVLSLLNAVLNAAMLLFPGWLVDSYLKGFPYIGKMLAVYGCLFLAYLITAYVSNRAADYRRILFERAVKKDFFDAVIQRDYHAFHNYDIAEYISMQANDITEMCMNYMNPLFFILDAIVMIIVFGVSLIIFVNIYVSFIILFFSALVVFVPRLTSARLAEKNKAYLDGTGQYTAIVTTLYEAHEILDQKGRANVTRLHEKELNHVLNLHMIFRKLNSLALVLNGGSVEFISVIVFATVAVLLCSGRITVGMATIAFTYSTKFMDPIYQLNMSIGSVLSVRKIQEKLLAIIRDRETAVEDVPDIHTISTTALEKNYADVKIHIPPITLHYPKKYLVLGENGAGKSVFFRLLMHFEDADSGQVLYNGCEKNAGISESICYVPQTPVLFQSSYEDNVTVYHTYDTAHLREYEAFFPERMIERIKHTSDPKNLSGGEKQIIAILRALCSEKPIILMDEPFAAMNQITIDCFMEKMQKMNRMLVIIAHNVDNYAGQFDEQIYIKRT